MFRHLLPHLFSHKKAIMQFAMMAAVRVKGVASARHAAASDQNQPYPHAHDATCRRNAMNTSGRLALLMLMMLAATVLLAQSKGRESELRTVRGTVVDRKEVPVASAVIYLRNVRTKDITTHISDRDGQFRFSGLNLNVDYEIHAENEGWTSAVRWVSSFDNRKEFIMTLKLDHKKDERQ
jgi:hypothetical protein